MLVRSEHVVEEIRARAELHAKTRPERWRRLGFSFPVSSDNASNDPGGRVALPRVSIVLATSRVEHIDACRRNIASQDYPNIEVIVVLHNDAFDEASVRRSLAGLPSLQMLRVPQSCNLGFCINLGVANATGDYVAKIDDDDFYGPSYISDLVLAALESGADITGKKASVYYFEDGQDYVFRGQRFRNRWLWPLTDETGHGACPARISRYASTVNGATLFVKRDVIAEHRFDESAARGTDTIFQLACRRAGLTAYASDEFNFCYQRQASGEGHLWKSTKAELLKGGVLLPSFDRSELCV